MTTRRAVVVLPLIAALLALTVSEVVAQSESAPPDVAAGPVIAVTAHDYFFGDLPESVPVGASLTLTNVGAELHEMIVVRKNDGVTESFDELIALPGDEAFQKITTAGPLFAAPGESASIGMDANGVPSPMSAITLAKEGQYLVICFVPQGTTEMPDFAAAPAASPDASAAPGSAAPAGPPHFLLGMKQEFTVTAAGSSPGPIPSAPPAHETPAESPAA
jgi:hypothetical protein